MNLLPTVVRKWLPGHEEKAVASLPAMQFPRGSSLGSSLFMPITELLSSGLGGKKNWDAKVGDGLRSSVLAGPLNWMMRTFPEAPPIVERFADAKWTEEPQHALRRLLRRPNPYYSGLTLWMCTVLDLAFGNAKWLKIRNSYDEVVQMWWVPRQLLRPRWPSDGSEYISHYRYEVGTGKDVPVRDVVHFRFGLDPRNPREGLSPLGALMREVGIDDEAASFVGAILENMGIIGVVISPKEKHGTASVEAVKEVKEDIKNKFKGENRGDPLAVGAPTDVQVLQYNMQGLDISPLRDVSEERVCAALGIPAAVVGFGTGLQQTKVGATMKEMRQLAWTGGLIPLQAIAGDEIDRSLLPEFEKASKDGMAPDTVRCRFDTSKVRALWEDESEKHDRIRKDFQASLIKRGEARQQLGQPPCTPEEDVYVQPVNLVQLGANGQPINAPAPSSDKPPAPAEDL